MYTLPHEHCDCFIRVIDCSIRVSQSCLHFFKEGGGGARAPCAPLDPPPLLYVLYAYILCTHHCAIATPMMYQHLATGGLLL